MNQSIQVLVVDDEAGIRKLVSSILTSKKYLSFVAGSTLEALEMVAKLQPDIVVSDVKMPVPDGLALLEEMGKRHPKIPVILMTGHGDKEMVIQALRGDAFDYLEKPFLDEELLSSVRRATEHLLLERELIATQAKMIQSSKMASLGEMAGGIAHEINTPLGTIALVTDQVEELVQEDPVDRPTVLQMTKTISDTVKRISSIITGLRAFSRDGGNDPLKPASLRQIVQDTLSLCKERFKHSGIQVTIDPISDDLMILCRPAQISQVILNLLSNACDAMKPCAEKWIKVSVENGEGMVKVSVVDCGAGVLEKDRKKIFQPFFTTKGIGEGTGLGLSISKGIIEAHNGTLTLDTESQNTRFVIRVPRA